MKIYHWKYIIEKQLRLKLLKNYKTIRIQDHGIIIVVNWGLKNTKQRFRKDGRSKNFISLNCFYFKILNGSYFCSPFWVGSQSLEVPFSAKIQKKKTNGLKNKDIKYDQLKVASLKYCYFILFCSHLELLSESRFNQILYIFNENQLC